MTILKHLLYVLLVFPYKRVTIFCRSVFTLGWSLGRTHYGLMSMVSKDPSLASHVADTLEKAKLQLENPSKESEECINSYILILREIAFDYENSLAKERPEEEGQQENAETRRLLEEVRQIEASFPD